MDLMRLVNSLRKLAADVRNTDLGTREKVSVIAADLKDLSGLGFDAVTLIADSFAGEPAEGTVGSGAPAGVPDSPEEAADQIESCADDIATHVSKAPAAQVGMAVTGHPDSVGAVGDGQLIRRLAPALLAILRGVLDQYLNQK